MQWMLRLHQAVGIRFAAFLDGSQGTVGGEVRVGLGVWRGATVDGAQLSGVRLRDGSINQDAELLAVYVFMLQVAAELQQAEDAEARLRAGGGTMADIHLLRASVGDDSGAEARRVFAMPDAAARAAAIDETLAWVADRRPRYQHALAVSDSETTVDEVERAWRSGTTAGVAGRQRAALLEMICELRVYVRRRWQVKLYLMWQRAHDGVAGNHAADAAAKAATHLKSTWEPEWAVHGSILMLQLRRGWPHDGTSTADSALEAAGKKCYGMMVRRLAAKRTWCMLGGVAGAEEYVGAAPTLDRVRLGWTRAPGDEPRWTAVAQEMDALATDTSYRGHEREFTPTGLRGSLSSDRWAIRCKKCPLCGTRAMVALDNKGAMGIDRRHLIVECTEIQSATARRAAWTSLVAAARAVPAANTAFTGEVT